MGENAITKVMEVKGTPTLKAIAAVLNVPAQRLYGVAKQPKEGVVYDARVYNWDAIERFVTRRLDADKGIATLDDVIDAALIKDEEFKEADGRRSSAGGGSQKNMIEVNGVMVPARKFKNFEMEADMYICLKKDANVYKIVMQTVTHTVLRPVDKDGNFVGETLKVISNVMLNMKGVGPGGIEDAIQKRFSGEYVDPDSVEETKPAEETEVAAE